MRVFERFPSINVADAMDRHHRGGLLLDVRESGEFRSGHPEGAVSAPLSRLESHLHRIPRDREVLVICASGNRSRGATVRLRNAGVDAVNVEGGLGAWARAGFPVAA